MISVVALVVCAAVVAAGLGVNHMLTARQAADATVNPNCTLIVPANPLTAQGLATPYQLTATDPAAGACDEANANQTAFVQGGVLNPATGQVSIYDPLVVNAGTQPAVAPVAPTLPAGAVVAVWFGYNGTTLTLAGADQNLTASASASATASATNTTTQPAATVTPTGSATATATGTAGSATPTASASQPASATPTGSASPTGSGAAGATAAPTASASAAATGASVQSVGSAPLPPSAAASLNASLSGLGGQTATGGGRRHSHPSASPSATSPASSAPAQAPTPTSTGTGTPTAAPTATATPASTASATPPAAGGTQTDPPSNPGDSPAASATPDAILQQANCVAGETIDGAFSSFTQVGACNATAFFSAANAAIAAHKLTVPPPGTGKDGQACLTTRSFALIDQDQSDNVTTEYLTNGNGQTAQDTAANRNALGAATTLFNGSDNGLLDLFVDPALGCSPWEVPNLADGGAPAPGLPLDELQAAAWAGRDGSPSALVPLNDPMTLDGNGNFSTDKTNTYRSLVDMQALPAGEAPATYCSDMEQIQGSRLQQDVNLLINGPSPMPAAASNLFTFLAMRLQQSFTNLNCGSFGQNNDVSTSADGNGVVVAACFVNQVGPVTQGQGNPMAGTTSCPATATDPTPSASAGQPGRDQDGHRPPPTWMSRHQVQDYWHGHHHG